MNAAREDHDRSLRANGARLTFFHLLWLVIALAAGGIAFTLAPEASIVGRIGLAIGSAIVGLLLGVVVVTWLVSALGMRPSKPGTYWSSEIEIYMRSIFGKKWTEFGEEHKDGS